MIQPLAWAKTFLRLADGDTLNLLLNSWTILAVAIDEEDVGIWLKTHKISMYILTDNIYSPVYSFCPKFHVCTITIRDKQTFYPVRLRCSIFLGLLARYYHIEPLLANGEGQYFLLHPYTSSQSVASISSESILSSLNI